MHSRPSHNRLSGSAFHSRIAALLLAMVSTMAAIYVTGRLWQEAADRVYLIQKLDKRNGYCFSAIAVDDTLKIIDCRYIDPIYSLTSPPIRSLHLQWAKSKYIFKMTHLVASIASSATIQPS
ncbi:hypothetical protein ACFX15_029633 [Malus domestica]